MSNSTFYGFTGRVLFIDLASRAVRTELLSAEEMRTYGGGSLLSAVLMLKTTRPGLDHRRIAGVVLQATMFNAFSAAISGSSSLLDGDAEPEALWDLLLRGIGLTS